MYQLVGTFFFPCGLPSIEYSYVRVQPEGGRCLFYVMQRDLLCYARRDEEFFIIVTRGEIVILLWFAHKRVLLFHTS